MTDLHGNDPCALCGRNPAAGFASIGDDWFCHGDDDPEPTCYMRAQRSLVGPIHLPGEQVTDASIEAWARELMRFGDVKINNGDA